MKQLLHLLYPRNSNIGTESTLGEKMLEKHSSVGWRWDKKDVPIPRIKGTDVDQGNGLKLCQERFRLDMRYNFFPKEVVKP